jgi:glutamyl-tRNA synthetase
MAWLSARVRGGTVRLRIEDIDSPRIKPGAAEQALDDLYWLGLDWDGEPIVQTTRLARYEAALDELQRRELVYPCTCTRGDIAAAASAPHAEHEGPSYPGTCSRRRVADAVKLTQAGESFAWRFRVEESPGFTDLFAGEQRINLIAHGGDFVVWKNTALGLAPPAFAHVPLVVGEDGRRLAKRHGDTRLVALREAGVKPEALLGLLAWSCGWIERPEPTSLRELLHIFRLDAIPKRPFVLTTDLLRQIGF